MYNFLSYAAPASRESHEFLYFVYQISLFLTIVCFVLLRSPPQFLTVKPQSLAVRVIELGEGKGRYVITCWNVGSTVLQGKTFVLEIRAF